MTIEETETGKQSKITTSTDLNLAIENLERKKNSLEEEMKESVHMIIEDLKPSNIINNTIHQFQESSEIKNNLLKVALGLGAGYFSRKLIVGKSAGIIKKTLGTALQYSMAALVARKKDKEDKSDTKPKRKSLLNKILSLYASNFK
jgi:hypothetical protein